MTDKEDKTDLEKIGQWTAIGTGIGASIGVATDNIGFWIPVWVLIGITVAHVLSRRE